MKAIKTLKEKLKTIPTKRLVLIGVIALLVISTVILTAIASRSKDTDGKDQNNSNDTDVFKPVDDTEENEDKDDQDKVEEPVIYTDARGLLFVSNGDGTCSISGMGTCTQSELEIPQKSPNGDTVIKIDEQAFKNCTSLLTVSIPSSVKAIGTGAFRGCSELVAINVSSDNSVYCSVGGVIFSKEKTVLVCYPINRAGYSYLLPSSVGAINSYAFEGVRNLEKLLYEENVSSFQKINILMGNEVLDTMSITCNYVPAK